MVSKIKIKLERTIAICVITLILIVFLFPIYWLISTSLKSRFQIFSMPPVWIFKPTLAHYHKMFLERPYPRYLLNSSVISIYTVSLSVLFGSIAAYGFSRFKFRGNKFLLFVFLVTRMIPPIAIVIPFFLILKRFRLIDVYPTLIIAYTTFNLPLVIWMMKGFFAEVPVELEEAAMIDGCSRLGAFRRVLLPLAAPGLAATAIFCLLLSWNEFLFALILTNTIRSQTAPIGVSGCVTGTLIEWGEMAAAATIAVTPIIIFALIVQKHLVRGLTLGAVKG